MKAFLTVYLIFAYRPSRVVILMLGMCLVYGNMLGECVGFTFDFLFSNGSAPTPRQTRQNPFDQREPAYDQRNNYELSQVGNRTNYNSAPVDDMTAFYNEVRATLAFRTEYDVSSFS